MAESPSIRSRLARRFDLVELRAIAAGCAIRSPRTHATSTASWRHALYARLRYELAHGQAGTATTAPGVLSVAAFPDNRFALTDIVVGPQGVFEAAQLTGTNVGPWAGVPASGLPISLQVLILFPWDPATERFAGERIWFDRGAAPP
jgi:hypothetical protein